MYVDECLNIASVAQPVVVGVPGQAGQGRERCGVAGGAAAGAGQDAAELAGNRGGPAAGVAINGERRGVGARSVEEKLTVQGVWPVGEDGPFDRGTTLILPLIGKWTDAGRSDAEAGRPVRASGGIKSPIHRTVQDSRKARIITIDPCCAEDGVVATTPNERVGILPHRLARGIDFDELAGCTDTDKRVAIAQTLGARDVRRIKMRAARVVAHPHRCRRAEWLTTLACVGPVGEKRRVDLLDA